MFLQVSVNQENGKKKYCLGLTGGIATGKSTALEMISAKLPSVTIFDADESVQRLLAQSGIVSLIAESLKEGVQKGDGSLDRAALRKCVFEYPEKRKILEEILHPKVREECLEKREEWLKNNLSTMFVADVPLLFEGAFRFSQDLNLVVATSTGTQRSRLRNRNHFDDSLISSILAAQLPILEKVARADLVFWNEGPREVLQNQIDHFIDALTIHE
ncbi:dephospho-CoA kinase [Akkermansiaceae bacterium]|nr:dephospho-CoA kinase [Akkermansiaceae bacterium]